MFPQPRLLTLLAALPLCAAAPEVAVRGGKLRSVPVPAPRKLRLCNAFASAKPLEMRRIQEPRLIEYPLPFKECRDYSLPLQQGDELLFRAGGKDVGTFSVQSLPSSGSLLLLVPHRKKPSSEAALAFQSHVFAQANLSQVALIDAFSGATHEPSQGHSVTVAETRRREGVWRPDATGEDLKFNSVVTLTPGFYHLALSKTGRQNASQEFLNANGQEAFVALRVGVGTSFPEELVVFPRLSLADLDTAARSKAAAHPVGSTFLIGSLLALSLNFMSSREPLVSSRL